MMDTGNKEVSDTYQTIKLKKDKFSENVVRKSLYWLSEKCKWRLNESHDSWEVIFENSPDGEEHSFELHRLLNDFLLREKLDIETGDLRKKIVSSSLRKICEG
jgi:His-Xaa-Ser system protein HxsD